MNFEKQEYQEQCVSNIMEALSPSGPDSIDATTLRDNLQRIQAEQDIAPRNLAKLRRLDIMMETGTGKTFTYLQTMYEINKKWKKVKKFIIFVPRLAIRAGVLQNIELTSEHFRRKYGKRIKKYIYGDKVGLADVERFINEKDEFSVLVLTNHSITASNENDRILSTPQERMHEGGAPLDRIGAMKPIIFIDEPHLLRGKEFVKSYDKYFSNSLLLRFGATFPEKKEFIKDSGELSNVVYSLDSLTAFQQNLVKRIGVYTVNDGETGIKFYKSDEKGYLVKIHYKENGKDKFADVEKGKTISTITNDPTHNYSVVKIKDEQVYLSNETKQDLAYSLTDDTIQRMIAITIENHFAKEQRLFEDGIKTLSLFFIPSINDFQEKEDNPSPRIKRIFEKEYKRQRKEIFKKATGEYKDYLARDYSDEGKLLVHGGYFSGDKVNEAEENKYVNLILNAKKELLSTETSLRFIFSVWALQEGWDNPNIFNICKLAPTKKETSRRQQVGRGLRLSVADGMNRQTIEKCESNEIFYDRNSLDVVVSGHEYGFIEGLQAEIIGSSITASHLSMSALLKAGLDGSQANRFIVLLEDEGIITLEEIEKTEVWKIEYPIDDFLENNREMVEQKIRNIDFDSVLKKFKEMKASPVEDKSKKLDVIKLRMERFRKFESLWETITNKAILIYRDVRDEKIIKDVKASFDKFDIAPLKMQVEKKVYDHDANEVRIENIETLGDIDFFKTSSYENFIMDFSKEKRLPLQFCHKMFNQLDKDKIKNNPNKAYQFLSKQIEDSIHKTVKQSIGYEFNGEIAVSTRKFFYEDDTCKKPKTEIKAGKVGIYTDKNTIPQDSYLYDKIAYDSKIERKVVIDDPANIDKNKIIVFAKLPSLSIPTPYKQYNPDFAYLVEREGQKSLILVVETKGYDKDSDIPVKEARKIEYAKEFFKELNKQSPEFEIEYRSRINKQELSELLQDIGGSNG